MTKKVRQNTWESADSTDLEGDETMGVETAVEKDVDTYYCMIGKWEEIRRVINRMQADKRIIIAP